LQICRTSTAVICVTVKILIATYGLKLVFNQILTNIVLLEMQQCGLTLPLLQGRGSLPSGQGFLTWGAEINFRWFWGRSHMWRSKVKGILLDKGVSQW